MPKEQFEGVFDRDHWEKQMENAPNLIKEADRKFDQDNPKKDEEQVADPKHDETIEKVRQLRKDIVEIG